jgi:hypothetical protein
MKRFLPILLFLAAPAFAQTQNPNGSTSGNLTSQSASCNTPTTSSTPNCIIVNVPSGASTASFQITGTFSATTTFEATGPALTWVALSVTPSAGGAAVTTATGAGLWTASVSGYVAVRMRIGTYVSGTAVETINVTGGGNFNPAVPGVIGGTTPAAGTFTTLTSTSLFTATNCSAASSSGTVACSAAPAGQFSCDTGTSAGTCVIDTTAIAATSEVFVQPDTSATISGVTCNTIADTGLTAQRVASRSSGTSFTINMGTFTTHPLCFDFWIVNP